MKRIYFLISVVAILASCNSKTEMSTTNPLLQDFSNNYQAAPFDKIKTENFVPAFKTLIEESENKINAIANCSETATFDNTIIALEESSMKLNRVSSIFYNLNSAETNSEMQKAAQIISPLLTEHESKTTLNVALFERIKALYNDMDNQNYSAEQITVITNYYKDFVRNGANLSETDKKHFVEIKKELSSLSLTFDDNLLHETNAFSLNITDEKDLAGLPQYVINAAKEEAANQNKEGWVFTLNYPSYVPFMQYSANRELREKMFKAYTSRANHNDKYDNKANVVKIANLRLELANILGYKTYADYALEERMALTPEKVNNFIKNLHNASRPFAEKEIAEVATLAKKEGFTGELQRWDFSYYSEKLKAEKYGFNEEMVKPYFELEKVSKGIFDLSNMLYGITFKEVTNIPTYNKDVKTFEVYSSDNKFISLLYMDFFPRESKQGGAWMTEYCSQSNINGKSIRPHISIVCNFTKPTQDTPSLLTFSEVTTFLHEFGHALHGMLTQCTYPSVSGTSVYRDFVELPSQIMENFAVKKEWLDMFAVHYKTGEKIPQDLIEKIIKAQNFQAGYSQERQLSFGMNDMSWHSINKPFNGDVVEFEKKAMSATELFPEVKGSLMSSSFSHIFAGGYASGYYGYKWAEVLDADAFSVFEKNGIFNKEIANSFYENILSKGGSEHPSKLYKQFRGQEPTVDALLERSGLK